jgi:hypothetical protein
MDVGVVAGRGVSDVENFGIFRVMGTIVDKGLDQEAVRNPDELILVEGQLEIAVLEGVAPAFELIAADIALVKYGVLHPAFAKEITAGQIRVAEMEMDRVVGGDRIKSVKLKQLWKRDAFPQVGPGIEIEASEIDVEPPDDSLEKVFKFLHCTLRSAAQPLRIENLLRLSSPQKNLLTQILMHIKTD